MSATTSIHEFPWLMSPEGVARLGVVMLPVTFRQSLLDDGYASGAIGRDDLYVSPDPLRRWVAGDVSSQAHVTLLYGLIERPTRSVVDRLFDGWERPPRLLITEWEVFPSVGEDRYGCIVARVRHSALLDAHARLSYLPHVNTFPAYKPHVTLAYVTMDAVDRWMEYLRSATQWMQHVEVPDGPLHLGDDA